MTRLHLWPVTVARSLVEAGLTLHHGAPWHPLRRLGGVCLLPVARTCDPGGHGGIVVSWTAQEADGASASSLQ